MALRYLARTVDIPALRGASAPRLSPPAGARRLNSKASQISCSRRVVSSSSEITSNFANRSTTNATAIHRHGRPHQGGHKNGSAVDDARKSGRDEGDDVYERAVRLQAEIEAKIEAIKKSERNRKIRQRMMIASGVAGLIFAHLTARYLPIID